MSESQVLKNDVFEIIQSIGYADILIGIPSFNNSATIAHVVRAVHAGCEKYFPSLKVVLINADGRSSDGTAEIVQNTVADIDALLIRKPSKNMVRLITTYTGVPGKGSAFRTVFEAAKLLDVKACAVVDSDLRSITPEWIELLIRPVLDAGFDFVAPLYSRHKYDGTITNSIIYPMTRSLYGARIRQPIGGDFGFSGKLASFYAEKDVWNTDVARFGIDIWMTVSAVANGFRVCQSFLGAKIHNTKDPGSDLSAMLYQVVGTMIMLMEEYSDIWKQEHVSYDIPSFGFKYTVGLEPVNVNLAAMVEKFKLGVRELASVYNKYISPEVMMCLSTIAQDSNDIVLISDEIWVRILYDTALACHNKIMPREHIIKALTPLYLGKIASFVVETKDSDAAQVEDRIEDLCRVYEHEMNYLVSKWQ